ncbi:MAG: ATPase [Breznakibacter sp.]
MKIIADSGSTKTQWCLLMPHGDVKSVYTQGINPYYQTSEQIFDSINNELDTPIHIESVHFYGAGCANDEKKKVVSDALAQKFGPSSIEINSDLDAAAFALCQHDEGIACILGTGSNSCYFDGKKITANVSPLGFILGDEGSGAVIGKKLVGNMLKKQFPAGLIDYFNDTYKLSAADITEHVYRKPFPNRYLAQFAKFVKDHIDTPELEKLVTDCFLEFIDRNLWQYSRIHQLPVHFTGSIAFHFLPQLKRALEIRQLHLGTVCLSPMEGLVHYHRTTR